MMIMLISSSVLTFSLLFIAQGASWGKRMDLFMPVSSALYGVIGVLWAYFSSGEIDIDILDSFGAFKPYLPLLLILVVFVVGILPKYSEDIKERQRRLNARLSNNFLRSKSWKESRMISILIYVSVTLTMSALLLSGFTLKLILGYIVVVCLSLIHLRYRTEEGIV